MLSAFGTTTYWRKLNIVPKVIEINCKLDISSRFPRKLFPLASESLCLFTIRRKQSLSDISVYYGFAINCSTIAVVPTIHRLLQRYRCLPRNKLKCINEMPKLFTSNVVKGNSFLQKVVFFHSNNLFSLFGFFIICYR